MTGFHIDADLLVSLCQIRENVRLVFEQLRLRSENGDVSGKDRLERVPALAKRNFGHLRGANSRLAVRQAWRLIDFLEGRAEARLTPLAREALRPIELDLQLARLRASHEWKEAALRLREVLGADGAQARAQGISASRSDEDHRDICGADLLRADDRAVFVVSEQGGRPASRRSGWSSRPGLHWALALIAVPIVGLLGWTIASPSAGGEFDPRLSCLALERASEEERAAHWAIRLGEPFPLPPSSPDRSQPLSLTISDPVHGPVRSIFVTSQFSYQGFGRGGPGGGEADLRLRVGGWGDTYLSLLKFPLPDNRPVRRAILRLTVLGDEPGSRPTTMMLRVVGEPWDVPSGADRRLWWRDCPRSTALMRLPAVPVERDVHYDIDITGIYNEWARGLASNHGIMLEPEEIGQYGSAPDRYPNFNTFYSTRAIDPDKRPKLILTY